MNFGALGPPIGKTRAENVAFTQAGTGAVERTAQSKMREVEVTPEDFDCEGDGTTDDTANLQLAINEARTKGVWLTLKNDYRITSGLDIYPSSRYGIRWEPGASIQVDFTGASGIALKATHPTVASTRGSILTLQNPRIVMHSNVGAASIGPVLLEHRYASDLKILGNGFISHYRNNTAVRLSAMFNCDGEYLSVWGGGTSFPRKSTTSITFSITSGATALTSSAAHFAASDVGKSIVIDGTNASELFTISAFGSDTSVTVSQTAKATHTAVAGGWEGVRGSMTSASSTLTLSDNVLAAADIGRVVYVLDAYDDGGVSRKPLRATITNVSGTTITLDTAATASVTDVYVLFSPAVEIYEEDTSLNSTNDAAFLGLHLEQFKGTGIVVSRAVNFSVDRLKLHALNSTWNDDQSLICGVFSGVGGFISGDFEGTPINDLGRIYVAGQRHLLRFGEWSGVGLDNQPLLRMANSAATSVVSIGSVCLNNAVVQATIDRAFVITGSGRLEQCGPFMAFGVTPNSQTIAELSSALTNTVGTVGVIQHKTSGAPAAGIGLRALLRQQTASGNMEDVGGLKAVMTDVTGASEDADLYIEGIRAGALAEFAKLPSTGGIGLPDSNNTHFVILKPTANVTEERTVSIDSGDADRTVTISGNANISQDYSETGSPTFGSPVVTSIELSHATANTLTGLGGDAFVEGNRLFRVGGADVPLADGGTGASTAILACANLGAPHNIAQTGLAGSTLTGTANETVLATIAFAANSLGSTGSIEVLAMSANNNSGNNKTLRVRIGASGAGTGGTVMSAVTVTTTLALKTFTDIFNRGLANSQIGGLNNGSLGSAAAALNTAAIDTTAAFEVVITGQLADSGDNMILEAYRVKLNYAA